MTNRVFIEEGIETQLNETRVEIEQEDIDVELYRDLINYYNCPLSKAELSELVATLKRAAQLGPEAYYSLALPNCKYGRIYNYNRSSGISEGFLCIF